MVSGLIGLLITIVIVGLVAWLLVYLLDMLPMDERFRQIGRVLIFVIAVLVILFRALPLLGVHVG